MRLDNIKLPFVDSNVNEYKKENCSCENKDFTSVLKSKEEEKKVQNEPNVENSVDEEVEVVDNFNLESDKVLTNEALNDISEEDIEEIVNIIYPIVIDFIKLYKSDSIESINSLSSGIVIGNSTEELKNMVSEFVNALPNIKAIEKDIQEINLFNPSIKESKILNIELQSLNVDNIINESVEEVSLDKNFMKYLVEEAIKNIAPINKEVIKDKSEISNTGFETIEKGIKEESATLTTKDEIKVLIKSALKEVISNEANLNKDNFKQIGKNIENYIPMKHIYVKEDGKVETIKVNEVQSQELKSVAVSTSDEESFLKTLIDGEEKTTKTDFILRNDSKILAPLTETNKSDESPVINRRTMINDVIKAIKYMERNAQRELTVKIYPKELGEISIKIIAGAAEGGFKASITASSKETYAILNSNINELKQNIANSEIKISEVNISLYNQDTTFHRDGNNQGYENKNGQKLSNNIEYSDIEEDGSLLEDSNHLGNLSMLV